MYLLLNRMNEQYYNLEVYIGDLFENWTGLHNKANVLYQLTWTVNRYCLLALRGSVPVYLVIFSEYLCCKKNQSWGSVIDMHFNDILKA